ncbi:hypothetical protein [Nitrococcus mobilis]|uniref:DUF4142 domain-containing protein n=1 Tax=Nitrococcus mobilis Nb-231 TaxID=314278 RepID=A4BLB4_9GAMM|nr:hypothetical protein [Nitrococcus mobilis]EAR23102.1 hypothetical protein NB231_14818 [Nitrococcus mobilis Nb-231]
MKMIKVFAALTASLGLLLSGATFAAGGHDNAATNWFGGPVYHGEPALEVTAALVEAGGGAEHFTFSKALVSMLGEETVNAEVAKLNKQYGEKNVTNFINGMTFAVHAALKRATEAGVKLPAAPADLQGAELAKALVEAGTTPDRTWWSGYLFDHALSHKIHVEVMTDIDAKHGHAADKNTHKILNQAMYDIAHALGYKNVKLAPLH